MNDDAIARYWMEKASQDLESAKSNYAEERYSNAIRDAYFACFHALSSLLIQSGKSFRKRREVRTILHRDYIKTNRLEPTWGKHYDWLFNNRHKADYRPLVEFAKDQVQEAIINSEKFIDAIKSSVRAPGTPSAS